MTTQQLTRGYRFGDIRLTGFVGSGGFADVYEGFAAGDRRVAVKVLRRGVARPDAEALSRFRREAEIIAVVQSDNVAAFVDADLDADPPWIATEFVDGVSLADHLARSGPLPARALNEFALVLAEALQAIHAQGVVHRDVTTHNVILGPAGPVLVDFGISSVVDAARITQTGQAFGTPGFVAPEVVNGHPSTPATDVYGWGRAVLAAAGVEPDEAMEGFSVACAGLIGRSVSDDPGSRPGLEEIQEAFLVGADRKKRRESLGRVSDRRAAVSKLPRRFRPRTLVAALVLGALTAAAVAVVIDRSRVDENFQFSDLPGKFNDVLGTNGDPETVATAGLYLSSAQVPVDSEVTMTPTINGLSGFDGRQVVLERHLVSADGLLLDMSIAPMTKLNAMTAGAALSESEGSEAWLEFEKFANYELSVRQSSLAGLQKCGEDQTTPQRVNVSGQDAIGLGTFATGCDGTGVTSIIDLWIPESRQKVMVLILASAPFDLRSFITNLGISKDPVVRALKNETIDLIDVPTEVYEPADGVPPSFLNVAFDIPAEYILRYSANPDDFINHYWLALSTRGDPAINIVTPGGAQSANRSNPASGTVYVPSDSVLVGYFNSGKFRASLSVSPESEWIRPLALNDATEAAAEGNFKDFVPAAEMSEPFFTQLDDRDSSYFEGSFDEVSFAGFEFSIPASWWREGTSGLFRWSRKNQRVPDFEVFELSDSKEAAVASGADISGWGADFAGLGNCSGDPVGRAADQGNQNLRWLILTECEVVSPSFSEPQLSRPQFAPVVVFQLFRDGEELIRGHAGLSNTTAISEWLAFVRRVMSQQN